MFLSWSIFVAAVALTSCVLWSSAGDVVRRGTSFVVYCTFNPTCKTSRSISRFDSSTSFEKQTHDQHNETTISLRVENITEKTTYSCSANCNPSLDDCGVDISAGYPPDRPRNISCIYRILKNDTGRVNCSWDRGRDTYLWNLKLCSVALRVSTGSGNHIGGPVPMCNVSNKGTESPSANFTLHRSARLMAVWVQAQNSLGSVNSSVVNYTLSDIAVMPSTPVVDRVECSSRNCAIKVEQRLRTQHLQIQYRAERQRDWTTYPDSVRPLNSPHISSLEPCSLYSFRARSRFSTGLWSQWSPTIANRTEEEVVFPLVWVFEAAIRSPPTCYEGAVYVFYNESSVSKTSFQRIATLEAAPEIGPLVQEKVEGNKVTVEWKDLPRAQRRGCITRFTIYLENSKGEQKNFAQASKRAFEIEGLPPDLYSLCMSASTSKGEGPAGQKIKFYIEGEHLFIGPQHHRTLPNSGREVLFHLQYLLHLLEIFRCLMPDVVPDPANSKWAKECTKEKGKMHLQLPSHNSSFSDPEEETILVDVEELCRHIGDSSAPGDSLLRVSSKPTVDQETELAFVLYPPITTYIKSFSHDSDSSDQTQESEETNVDYISSHEQENLQNCDQEDEEEFPEMHFFPSLSIFMEPAGFGGKLTLDAVKIDCSDFFQNA
uniref:Interleukin 12 receptor, beta 2a n=1 Tax=Fundulus heteroclitus TaxID=8078 RepID=A0A3Q2NNF6_FUNHE